LIGAILEIGSTLIKRLFPDPKMQQEAQLELLKLQESGDLQRIAEQSKIIVAEAKSDSWLARNWRPMTMVVFVFIIFNNYVLVPYQHLLGIAVPVLAIPPKMWSLLELGLGGYVVSRGIEKVTKNLKGVFKKD
jgi:hypothetical protein